MRGDGCLGEDPSVISRLISLSFLVKMILFCWEERFLSYLYLFKIYFRERGGGGCIVQVPTENKRLHLILGAGVTGYCEPPNMIIQILVLRRAVNAPNILSHLSSL